MLMLFTYLLSKHYSIWSLSLFFLSGLIQAFEGMRLLFTEWMEEDFPQVCLLVVYFSLHT
jgi:hypothetical protein